MTAVDTRPVLAPVDSNVDDLTHLVCHCTDDRARCGKDVSQDSWDLDRVGLECVVCVSVPSCARCGI